MPVDAYCKGCAYLGTNSMGKCCDYNYITGKVRGCPAGEGCERRDIGAKRRYTLSFASKEKHRENSKKASITANGIGRPKGKETSELEEYDKERLRKKRAREANRAKLQGRQRAVIMEYKIANNASCRDIAERIGIHESTVQKWCNEYQPARWDLLEKIGIKKPEGLD